jgi:hypothetical protein
MPLDPALATELRGILARYRVAHGVAAVPNSQGKALEAWVLMRLAEKARSSTHWDVSLRRADETPVPIGASFDLPVGQSGIPPSHPTGRCHVLLRRHRDGLTLELHGSLQWLGRSTATHECDISVLPGTVASTLRTHGGGRPEGLPVAAYECKDKTSSAKSDEMREKVARLFDLVLVTRPQRGISCRIYVRAAGGHPWGTRSSTYRSFFYRGTFGVVRAGGFDMGARRLATHYHIKMHGDIYNRLQTITELENGWAQLLNEIDSLR